MSALPVVQDGALYELDGRKAGPVNHGPTTPERLLVGGLGSVLCAD